MAKRGRPLKPQHLKRVSVNFSMFDEDLTRLMSMTDKPSAFVRTLIKEKYDEKNGTGDFVQISVRKSSLTTAMLSPLDPDVLAN